MTGIKPWREFSARICASKLVRTGSVAGLSRRSDAGEQCRACMKNIGRKRRSKGTKALSRPRNSPESNALAWSDPEVPVNCE